MIRINLLGEKEDNTGVYALQGSAYAACILLSIALCGVVHISSVQEVDILEDEKRGLQTQLAILKKKTKEVDLLEAKEQELKDRKKALQKLKAKKQFPVRVLHELTEFIPKRTWVTAVSEKNGILTVEGVALDNQTISNFMTEVEKSKYFGEPDFNFSRKYERFGVALQKFVFTVKLEDPLAVRTKAIADEKKSKGRRGSAQVAAEAEKNKRKRRA